MTMTLKNILAVATTTHTELYTTPANTTTVITGLQVANIHSSVGYVASVSIRRGGTDYYIVNLTGIPAKAALTLADGKLVLQAGDSLCLSSDVNSFIHLVGSVMEQS